jgi:hypothetical protein
MWVHAWDPDQDDLFATPTSTQADPVKRAVLEHSFGLIFEDDTEVSPFFFQWLHTAVRTYYANEDDEDAAKENSQTLTQIELQRMLLKAGENTIDVL